MRARYDRDIEDDSRIPKSNNVNFIYYKIVEIFFKLVDLRPFEPLNVVEVAIDTNDSAPRNIVTN